MTEDDLFHTGATVFIKGQSYKLGAYRPDLPGWELWQDGFHLVTIGRGHLRKLIDGIKFKEAS